MKTAVRVLFAFVFVISLIGTKAQTGSFYSTTQVLYDAVLFVSF